MKILNRFLLQHFLRILLLSCGAFIGIYLLIDFLEKIGDFIDHKATAGDYLIYMFNSVPVIFVQILPLAILMSVVLTLGTLGRTNEITAMRACGFGLWRIVRPLMLLAIGLSLLLLSLNEFVVPLNTKALNELLEVKLQGKQQLTISRDEIWYRDSDRIINILLANPIKKRLQGVTIFHIDSNSRIYQRLESPRLKYSDGSWHARELTVRTFDPLTGDLLQTEKQHNQTV
ncbi:LptF/LptG family permease, partial [Deltaproteobacteria bacterium]|nr:LptF/LptG family permease [Deltaproteobacteria bacterium]